MFKTSVCSYPARGEFGNNKYRGNCTGHIIKDFIGSYMTNPNGLFADPSIGGGTSVDVAKHLGINFKGTDLHQGFNLLTDDFSEYLQGKANLIFWHPPYWDMLNYSGKEWGTEPHKWDLSHMSLDEFLQALELALMNIHDACEDNGHYGILMGNLRRKGVYYNLSSMVERLAPGRLVDEIIKVQHNCVSDKQEYKGKVVRIAHEKLLVFKKTSSTSLSIIKSTDRRTESQTYYTFCASIRRLLQGGKSLSFHEICERLRPWFGDDELWVEPVKHALDDLPYFVIDGSKYKLAD